MPRIMCAFLTVKCIPYVLLLTHVLCSQIVLDLAANATVALSDIGVARLPGSDVVWDRGGKQNGGTGGSVGGALMPCDTTLCPYSAVANVLPAPAYYGGDGSGSGEGNANSSSIGAWCAQASLTGGPTKEPRRVNYSPQSPASLLMGSVNKRYGAHGCYLPCRPSVADALALASLKALNWANSRV